MGHFLLEEEGPHPQGGEGLHRQEEGGLHHQGKEDLHPPEEECLRHLEGEDLHHLGKGDLHLLLLLGGNDPLLQGEGDFHLQRPCLHPLAETQGDLHHLTHQEEREAHPGAVAAVAAALQELRGEFPFPADTTGAFHLEFVCICNFPFFRGRGRYSSSSSSSDSSFDSSRYKYCHHQHYNVVSFKVQSALPKDPQDQTEEPEEFIFFFFH